MKYIIEGILEYIILKNSWSIYILDSKAQRIIFQFVYAADELIIIKILFSQYSALFIYIFGAVNCVTYCLISLTGMEAPWDYCVYCCILNTWNNACPIIGIQ